MPWYEEKPEKEMVDSANVKDPEKEVVDSANVKDPQGKYKDDARIEESLDEDMDKATKFGRQKQRDKRTNNRLFW